MRKKVVATISESDRKKFEKKVEHYLNGDWKLEASSATIGGNESIGSVTLYFALFTKLVEVEREPLGAQKDDPLGPGWDDGEGGK